jgi:hypothetical protein
MKAWSNNVLGKPVAPEPMAEEMPPDVKIVELDFLTDEQKALLAALGTELEAPGNPPAWATDDATWERAKEAVEPYWGNYSEPYAVTTHVYRAMGGTVG